MSTTKLRSPLQYFGGKFLLSKKLIQYIPQHKYYLEVFGGGANLLLTKSKVPFEVYNDIDGDLVNFFRVLRDKEKFEEFYHQIQLMPVSREEYYYCKENYGKQNDEIKRAVMWYYYARNSFFGRTKNGSFGYSVTQINRNLPSSVSRWLSIIDLLPEIHKRIMQVQIEHLDWKDCLDKYNWGENEKSFTYLDPPYVPSVRKSGEYNYEMSEYGHSQLVDYLIENFKPDSKNKFTMLSGYDNEIYKKLEENGWYKMKFNVYCPTARGAKKSEISDEDEYEEKYRREEVIWLNYSVESLIF